MTNNSRFIKPQSSCHKTETRKDHPTSPSPLSPQHTISHKSTTRSLWQTSVGHQSVVVGGCWFAKTDRPRSGAHGHPPVFAASLKRSASREFFRRVFAALKAGDCVCGISNTHLVYLVYTTMQLWCLLSDLSVAGGCANTAAGAEDWATHSRPLLDLPARLPRLPNASAVTRNALTTIYSIILHLS